MKDHVKKDFYNEQTGTNCLDFPSNLTKTSFEKKMVQSSKC